jgi:uncharacterized membrane protein (UPF0127 family)
MRLRIASLRSLVALAVALAPLPMAAKAQDLNVPYVAPRPANTLVMLPDGSTVHVELARTPAEQAYGLMGRTSLPAGRGMLFIEQPGKHAYWMYHCKIGLDIVWMNGDHQIVEMSPDTPPCRGKSSTCPTYGGHVDAQYVLELPVGSIRKHRLADGERVEFAVEP